MLWALNLLASLGFQFEICYTPQLSQTTAEDTEQAATAIAEQGVDLLLFAGGDGTARNICAAVGERATVLGVPAGCKIHSGVYAISPSAAGKVIAQLVKGELVTLTEAAVMDIDETAFRQGIVRAKRFGEMRIPAELRYIQSVKNGGKEAEELVLDDLAAYIASEMDDNVRYVMGLRFHSSRRDERTRPAKYLIRCGCSGKWSADCLRCYSHRVTGSWCRIIQASW